MCISTPGPTVHRRNGPSEHPRVRGLPRYDGVKASLYHEGVGELCSAGVLWASSCKGVCGGRA